MKQQDTIAGAASSRGKAPSPEVPLPELLAIAIAEPEAPSPLPSQENNIRIYPNQIFTYIGKPIPSASWFNPQTRIAKRMLRKEAKLYERFEMDDLCPDKIAASLRTCANAKALSEGKHLHHLIVRKGLESKTFLGNLLIQMYGKCGALPEARAVFDKMKRKNSFTWNIMIAGYAQLGQPREALDLFKKMPQPNTVSWNTILAAYAQVGLINVVHDLFGKMPERNVISWTTLLSAYVHQGKLQQAYDIFQDMPCRNIVSWNIIIGAYAQRGHLKEALQIFKKMPNPDVISWNALISGFVRRGQIKEADELFRQMPFRDIVSWNAMLAGYAQNGQMKEAFRLFEEMPQKDGISWNTMLTAYTCCGQLEDALSLFRRMPETNTISWNTMISAYVQHGWFDLAIELFHQMPNPNIVAWTLMISCYAQKGELEQACQLFQKLPERDVVTWTALISAYANLGLFIESFRLLGQMQLEGINADRITYISMLDACASHTALVEGKQVHTCIIFFKLPFDVTLRNALVNMYAKCGDLHHAHVEFDKMPERNLISWNTMVASYAQHGEGQEALRVLRQMGLEGTRPDGVTMMCILASCSHSGMVDDGYHYFISTVKDNDTSLSLEHFNCMIDLSGRAGHLEEAEAFVNNLPLEPDITCWRTFLGTCRTLVKLRVQNSRLLDSYTQQYAFCFQ